MIRLIPGSHRADFPREIAAMHEIRKRTFHDRLGWQVKTLRSWEIDEFDALNPLYLISIGPNDVINGSLRLLPTTGPNMLADVFPELLPDNLRIESATIWEIIALFRQAGSRCRTFGKPLEQDNGRTPFRDR